MKIHFCLYAFCSGFPALAKMKPFSLHVKLDDKRLLVRPDFWGSQLCLRGQVPLLLSLPTTRKSGSEENGPGGGGFLHDWGQEFKSKFWRESTKSKLKGDWFGIRKIESASFIWIFRYSGRGKIDSSCTSKRKVRVFDTILRWQIHRSRIITSTPGYTWPR